MLLNDNAVSPAEASQQSALTLAYLGDAVYELLVREKLVIHSHKTNGKLHFEATRRIPMSPFTNARRVLKRFSGICIFREGRKE